MVARTQSSSPGGPRGLSQGRAGHGGVKPRAFPTRRWRRPASVPLAALRSAGQNRGERGAEAQPDLLISRRQPRPPPSRAGARGGGGGAAGGRPARCARRGPGRRPPWGRRDGGETVAATPALAHPCTTAACRAPRPPPPRQRALPSSDSGLGGQGGRGRPDQRCRRA